VRILVNNLLCGVALVILVVLLFSLGHAVLLSNILGFNWPALNARWGDGLAVFAALSVLFLLLRRLLVASLRTDTKRGEWLALALFILPFLTGLFARSGVTGYEFWLFLHLVCGHVFLWCAPHCRFAHLLR
jgi:hypothetical protein